METELTAKFQLLDEMSDKIGDIAESGQELADVLEDVGDRAGNAFDEISDNSVTAASSVDGVATSFNAAATQTDYWTEKVGNYDTAMLEAVYSTEELVDMGYKSADALNELNDEIELCDRMAMMLSESMEGAAEEQENLANASEAAGEVMAELNQYENASVETKEDLQRAAANAAEAMEELAQAQKEAEVAMQTYDEIMMSGTNDLDELEHAAETACWAAEALQEANQKAADATEQLSKSTENASEELEGLKTHSENAGDSAMQMITGISSALAGAGIIVMVKQITDSVIDLANAFSEAESIIVDATGATGSALESLEASMMSAYANNYNDLNTVAGAIGEINTRMGLTGDELSTTTDLFLDFSNVTGTNVVSAVQDATKVMNKYGLETSDLNGLLDQLTYAGQISGASVSSLSSTLVQNAAVFQNAGLSVENAIAMLADFELAGINSSTAAMGLRTAVNSLAADGEDVQEGLQRVVREIAEMEDQSEATALAVEVFGSRAGQELAMAIQNGTISVETFSNTLEGASGTLATTADASMTLANKWQEANNKMNAAFTSALQPTINAISSSLADLMGSIGDFLNEHPAVTKALSAIAVGVGATVVAVAGAAAAFGVATTAAGLFGVTLSAAIWPLTAVAAGIAAVTGAVLILKGNYDNAYDASMSMTASTRAQTEELSSLQAEYDRACDEFGELDDRTLTLKYQIDDLTASLASNGQTMAEFYAEIDSAIAKNTQLFDSYDSTAGAIHDQEVNSLALIQKLQDLANASNGTQGSEEAMKRIIDELNGSVSGLDLTYDDFIGNQDKAAESAKRLAQAQAEQDLKVAQWEELMGIYGQIDENATELAKVDKELAAAQEEAAKASEAYSEVLARGDIIGGLFGSERAEYNAANDKVEELTQRYDEYKNVVDEATARQEELERALGITADTTAELANETEAMQARLTDAYTSIEGEIKNIKAAYDEAYEAAVASFEGQFGLFDQATASAESSVSALLEAQQSQLDYWTTYSDNIAALMNTTADDLGITEEQYNALMSNVTSGTEQAAGLAASLVEEMGKENSTVIQETAETMEQVAQQRELVAQETAAWSEDLNGTIGEAIDNIAQSIDGLDLSDEASAAAMSTIEAYIAEVLAGQADVEDAYETVEQAITTAMDGAEDAGTSATNTMEAYVAGIEASESEAVGTATGVAESTTTALDDSSGASAAASSMMSSYSSEITAAGQEAVSAAKSISSQVASALNTNVNVGVSGAATGTTNAPSIFVAGERGHELIVPGHAGGTMDGEPMYMAGENGPELIVGMQGSTVFPKSETDRLINSLNGNSTGAKGSGRSDIRHIILEIAGSGSIDIGAGTDVNRVIELIQDNLKPVLLNILQQEVLEEGELSYEF